MKFLRFLQFSPTKRRGSRRMPHGYLLSAELLEPRTLLTAQVIAASPATQSTAINSTASFDVVYSTATPANATTTGLSLRMHYNSAELTPNITAIMNSAFAGATIQDTADTSNFDSDATTDRFVNFLWFDIDGTFPSGQTLPLKVFTATFATTASFNGATVGFTSTPPTGFDFTPMPAQINLLGNSVAGNVDGDTDFDANDAFLISLIKLGGTDAQINQSKGASPLTAAQIRAAVNALSANVDGDSDTDANDAFLIQLVKLGGTDAQINRSKGASPLTAVQIRANVDVLGSTSSSATSSSVASRKASQLAAAAPVNSSQQLFDHTAVNKSTAPVAVLVDNDAVGTVGEVFEEFRSWIDAI